MNAAAAIQAVLVPFMLATGALLLILLAHVFVLHLVRDIRLRRRDRRLEVYRPLVAAALLDSDPERTLARLRAAPRRHRPVIAGALLDFLRAVKGSPTERARAVADALELTALWNAALGDRRWWVRADAAHALGLIGHRPAVASLIRALDDPYEEVRAAAVEALGRIADPAAIRALVARLPLQSRHQRVRLVEALQHFGLEAAAPLLAHADARPADAATIAELLGTLEAPAAVDRLRDWCGHADAQVRAAALRALGRIGIDDRTYYHVLRSLSDDDPAVRAAAAWALGRSGRPDAAAYLAARLSDEWSVAAESARALRHLGDDGRRALETAAAADGSELARQVLWEAAAAGTGA